MTENISRYIISNANGMSAEILNYGAIVSKLLVPDVNGQLDDVILGFDNLESYISDESFQGAIVGRYGNRIAGGRFVLEGIEYDLTRNEGANQLHGGSNGFNKVLWNVEEVNNNSIILSYDSPDGEEGFPGNVKITVEYKISDENEFQIYYSGTTDKTTVLNPTNHCYFNLTGTNGSNILDHIVQIDADYITEINKEMIPTGNLIPLEGTPMDFRAPTAVGKNINADLDQLKLGSGYDHNYVLNKNNGSVRKVAEVYDPVSKRVLEVFTDQPGIQFYSGNHVNQITNGKGNSAYSKHAGLCLEAQGFPDSPNKPHFPSVALRPGETYKQTTIYKFSNR